MLSDKQEEVKRSLEPTLRVLEVAGSGATLSPGLSGGGSGAVYLPPSRTPPRPPLLTGLEVVTIVLGCVVFLGALIAAFCVVCLSKKR